MQAIFGIDFTQDGSRVVSEVIAFNMKPSELEKTVSLMLAEHDDVYGLELDQNSQVFIDAITKGRNFTK